ncbi:unnamed protein product [Phytomonas sp. EM1]|nr:unnamed protein product [Phytomonas sp. EM1]|eukprot:CCW65479.1 unnamed protein product [Phytomonas sp. isolate EM1]
MTTATYCLERQVRSICPLYHFLNTEQECHRFLVGSSNCTAKNKIHLLEFQDETNTLECSVVWNHESEINGMWSSPSLSGKSLLATASTKSFQVLQVSENLLMEPKQILSLNKGITQALWDLEGLQNDLKIVQPQTISTLSLETDKIGAETTSYSIDCERIFHAALDPHHSFLCLLSCAGSGLQLVDFRSKQAIKMENTDNLHGFQGTLHVDFSTTKPNKILTCGHDGIVHIHEFRMNSKNIDVEHKRHIRAHEHTVRRALFNSFHDSLVLSGSSDQSLKLWDLDDVEKPNCIRQLGCLGDTVMDIFWSSNGPWVFGGVSYNGRVMVDTVPSEKKMSILLEEQK